MKLPNDLSETGDGEHIQMTFFMSAYVEGESAVTAVDGVIYKKDVFSLPGIGKKSGEPVLSHIFLETA